MRCLVVAFELGIHRQAVQGQSGDSNFVDISGVMESHGVLYCAGLIRSIVSRRISSSHKHILLHCELS